MKFLKICTESGIKDLTKGDNNASTKTVVGKGVTWCKPSLKLKKIFKSKKSLNP